MLKATVLPMLIKLSSAVKRKEKIMLLMGRWSVGCTCRTVSRTAHGLIDGNGDSIRGLGSDQMGSLCLSKSDEQKGQQVSQTARRGCSESHGECEELPACSG